MSGYHRFIFDESRRRFVGRFDEMYRQEHEEHYDSWHQEDARNLVRRTCLAILDDLNLDRVLDLGCGKGAFTHRLKKANNLVVGIDVSETALAVARGRYPDVQFKAADMGAPEHWGDGEPFDLIVCLEALSYIEHWRPLLGMIAARSRRVLLSLYLPDAPLGFVKTFDDLTAEFARHFHVDEQLHFVTRRQLVLFGRSTLLSPNS
ncbi:MAG: methyltransferase domain-containing protein [Vicinamibacterales bacterium]